jgi:hypothetical protein
MSQPPAANGAERKFGWEFLFAKTAGFPGFRGLSGAGGVGLSHRPLAAIADEHRLTGLDLEHGDEEEADVVVHPL